MTRVFIFGIDAGSLKLIKQWKSHLPNFSRLMNEGCYGILQSTIPPFTSPAWACMSSGKNPAKVGIFGLRHRKKDSYEFEPPTSMNRHAPALWEIAGQHGRFSTILNVPDTYPPTQLQGHMISGRPAPVEAVSGISYPSELLQELNLESGHYQRGPGSDFDDGSRKDELGTWKKVLASHQDAILYLMTNKRWDLFFYVSMAIDGICHHFWQHLDKEHPDYDPEVSPQFSQNIQEIYKVEDARIGEIISRLNEDDLFLVVSDHGSTPVYHQISVNRWLIDNGYLVLKNEQTVYQNQWLRQIAKHTFSLYRKSARVRHLLRPFRSTKLRDTIIFSQFANKSDGRIPFDALPVDWEKTTAYYLGDNRIYLNLAGREPHGVVQPENYEQIRDKLRKKLADERFPNSDQPLFSEIYNKEEIYEGPYLDKTADLILVPGSINWSLGGAVGEHVVDKPVVGGKHHPDGVFLAWGSMIKPGERKPASIYDIAPTVLHTLGIPIPDNCDGQVQTNWFKENTSPAQTPVRYETVEDIYQNEYQWREDEMSEMEDRLRDLGYLD